MLHKFCILLVLLSGASRTSEAAGFFVAEAHQKALGKRIGATFTTTTPLDQKNRTQQARTTTALTVLGKNLSALQSTVTDTPDGTTYIDVYSFGLRVFSQSAYFSHNGILGINAGLLPTEVRVPFVFYPVGPLTLEIDGGARFMASLVGQISPTIIINEPALSSLAVNLQAEASATGFVQGYAELLVLRGGIGGDVNLVDASANLQAQFRFDGSAPTASVSAFAKFFYGSFYGFADYFDILVMGWTRFWTKVLYAWKGFCFSTESASCSP